MWPPSQIMILYARCLEFHRAMKSCPKCRVIYPDNYANCPQDATPLMEAEGWSEGSVVRGKYRILSKIGQGGMGTVYKALHVKLDQLRALKMMSRELAVDSEFGKRFEQEARLLSRLRHANVVRVDDIEASEDGRPYIVMEFVEGRSLRQIIQIEGPLPPPRVCSIAKQVAAGLGAAHLLEMVHRGVKPDNIMLLQTADGEMAKVLDFGIAKLKDAKWVGGLHTATGFVLGTPQYLSPEQASGIRSEVLDGRSDLYSLGVVMYEMLTQKLPYDADSVEGWMKAHAQGTPAAIRVMQPDWAIPDALINLVMRCLKKDREFRPPNAEELIHGIERVEELIRRPMGTVLPTTLIVHTGIERVEESVSRPAKPVLPATKVGRAGIKRVEEPVPRPVKPVMPAPKTARTGIERVKPVLPAPEVAPAPIPAKYPDNSAEGPRDATPLAKAGDWSEGTVVRGKYRILSKVGQGGMATVYKALHLAFDELRALKVIAPELLMDELFVKRFKHEALITRKLQHPNAVRVDYIDEAEDGRPYIVMEFIDGKSLLNLIRKKGPLPVLRVCSIIKQCASALDAAHKLGMVHRDIKPDNIALVDSPDGETVKVLDFGIAKVKEARMGEAAGLTLTGAGVVIGTPQYMSPEQAMGKRGDELDGRADLYSLGVVMYQMLTADLPFRADSRMEMLLAHMQKPPTPIGVSHPELQVPENIAGLTLKLLEKNQNMRPANAQELIREINGVEAQVMRQT